MSDISVALIALAIGCANVVYGCYHMHQMPEASAYYQVNSAGERPVPRTRRVLFDTAQLDTDSAGN